MSTLPTRIEKEAGRPLPPLQIFDITAARETTLSRLLMLYISTGLLFMLLPGTFLGVWNLFAISNHRAANSASLMFFVAVPVALVPAAASYRNLLVVAFLLGMAGSSFAVGVGYVSRWFSMERQGSALGVYGLGNIGQSAAVFLGPVVAAAAGFRTVYWG